MKINKYNRATEKAASKRQFNSLTEVTPSEKEQIKEAFFSYMFEKITLSSSADIYKVDKTAYLAAYSAMKALVCTLIEDMNAPSFVDERDYLQVFCDFLTERKNIYDALNKVTPIECHPSETDEKLMDRCAQMINNLEMEKQPSLSNADSNSTINDRTEGPGCLLWFFGLGAILAVIIHFANKGGW